MPNKKFTLDRLVTYAILLSLFFIGLAFTANYGNLPAHAESATPANSNQLAVQASNFLALFSSTENSTEKMFFIMGFGLVVFVLILALAGGLAMALQNFTKPKGYKDTSKKRSPLNLWAGR